MKQSTTAAPATRPSTDCQQAAFQFQALGGRDVVADFTGGTLSSDGGALLLRQLDGSLRLTAGLAGCFRDERDPRYVEHTLPELLRQRVMAIALGYEDLNDHAALRRDPLLAAAAGKSDVLGTARARCRAGRAR